MANSNSMCGKYNNRSLCKCEGKLLIGGREGFMEEVTLERVLKDGKKFIKR